MIPIDVNGFISGKAINIMKFIKLKKIFISCVALVMMTPAVTLSAADNGYTGKESAILFTHDTHSHLNSFFTIEDGETFETGGFARIKTLIDQTKAQHPDTLILDAGDFSMGTLIQSIFHTEAAELRMLGALGCDVTTLGNHEFDYRSEGLAGALRAAVESNDPIPSLVLANIDWETMEAEGLTEDQKLLKEAFDAYGMSDYTVITKGDIKYAVFGIFGENSLEDAPTCVLKFKKPSEAAREIVAQIKENEEVDMIVCVSHSGTSPNKKKSEDELLAKEVPEIDLIISGHSHTTLEKPICYNNTYIVSCGLYGMRLGSLSMRQKSDGRWEMSTYDLIPVTPDIPSDNATQAKIDRFMEIVDSTYLADFGYTSEQVLARNNIVFSTSPDLYNIHTDHNLGNIMSDAFVYAVENAKDFDGKPVDISIVPAGCVRDTYPVGDITVRDVFNAYSLGIGIDKVPGYPLISIYLTGAELKKGAEIDASIAGLMHAATLYMSGTRYTFNPHRILLNKVTECSLTDRQGNDVEIDDNKLYRIVCDLYSGQMLGAVTKVSKGLISIQPKFADGTPVENIEDAIITTEGKELKAWAAMASYFDSFEDVDGDGISDVPAIYEQPGGRKIVDDSKNIVDLVKNPNKYAVIIISVILFILTLLISLIIFVIKRIVKKRR